MKRITYVFDRRDILLAGSVWRSHVTVLILYMALAVLLTWPTVTHLNTHLPGDGGDDPAIAWNLWWVKHALLVLQTSPLCSDYLFYPIGINLAFYTLTVLNALTALPLTLNLGVVAVSNLHTWFTMVVGAYGTFLLVRQLCSTTTFVRSEKVVHRYDDPAWGPAIFAGICYAFCSSQLFYVTLGQFNIASSHWVPYIVLCVHRSRNAPHSIRWPLLTALFLVMQLWAEMTYASFSIVFIALYIMYEMSVSLAGAVYPGRQRAYASAWQVNVWPVMRSILTASALFLVGAAPLLAAVLPDLLEEGDFWVQGSGFAEIFSADLLGFLVPTMRHPFFGGLVHHTSILAFDKGQHIYIGITLLVLAIAGISQARQQRIISFWIVATLFFAWLTLGPLVHVNGVSTGIGGPFAILQVLPFFKGNRYPSRYSVFLMLSLAVLAAWGIAALRRLLNRHRHARGTGASNLISLIAACIFLAEHLSLPLPQSDMRVPEIYASLASASTGNLLDIPFAWRNGFRITGPIDPSFMFGQFYQTVHHRRLLQGNTSRNPAFKFQYFTEAPVLNSLLALETGHTLPPERWEADRLLAGDVLRFFDIQHIVVRRAHSNIGNPSVTPEATIPYIEAVFPVERIDAANEMHVYRVNLPPLPRVVEVNPSAPLVRLYLGEGWGPLPDQQVGSEHLLWAQRTRARLLLPLESNRARLAARLYVPGEGQRIAVQLGNWRSERSALAPGWNEYAVQLPAGYMQTGLNEIWLHFDRLYPVDSLAALAQPSPSTLHRLWYTNYGGSSVMVQSAGEEVGDFAHVYLDGRDVALNTRGYNVVVLEQTGDVRIAAFDTHADATAAHQLAQFITQVPENTLVAVAVADEASMRLDEIGVAALRTLGATGDIRGRFRWSHAIIGVKGSAPGTALEALDGLRPVTLALGAAVSAPSVAAGIAWLRCESN